MNQHEKRKMTHANDMQVTVEWKPPDTPASEVLENDNAVCTNSPEFESCPYYWALQSSQSQRTVPNLGVWYLRTIWKAP